MPERTEPPKTGFPEIGRSCGRKTNHEEQQVKRRTDGMRWCSRLAENAVLVRKENLISRNQVEQFTIGIEVDPNSWTKAGPV